MIALGVCLLVAAWLWGFGLEVPARAPAAWTAWGLGLACLAVRYVSASRRLPPRRRLGRAAGWTLLVAAATAGLAHAVEPLVDLLAPWLSHAAGPSSWLAAVARAAGIESVGTPAHLVMQDHHQVPAHGVSLQQLGLAAALAALLAHALATSCRVRGWWRSILAVAAALAMWAPVRYVLVTSLAGDLGWMGARWHPLAVAASLLPALWAAERLRPLRSIARWPLRSSWRMAPRAALAAGGAAVVLVALTLVPAGERAPGRVLVDDAHSDWEWTWLPFDRTTWGRRSTYTYRSLVDFLGHHYRVQSHLSGELTDAVLARHDVLVLKTPTEPFLASERDAVVRFVERGGGLVLVSDHTNLFGMSTYLNPMGEPFGLEFAHDDTFELVSGQPSRVTRARLARPAALATFPGMQFETSCTLRPRWRVRPILVGRGLGSELVDYSHVNFFGNIQADPGDRWGAFLQAAWTRHGRGRVVAFTDSTVFSNFSMFFEGKPELALGLVEFVNRRPGPAETWLPYAAPLGLAAVALAIPWTRRRTGRRRAPHGTTAVVVAIACALGAGAAGAAVTAYHVRAYTPPAPSAPFRSVVFDAAHGDFRLPTLIETSISDSERCFDAFFVALQRMHLFPSVTRDLRAAVRRADAIVLVRPSATPSAEELDALHAWVRAGGRLVVLESSTGSHATTNRILAPAGVAIVPALGAAAARRPVALSGGEPVTLDSSEAAPDVAVARVGRGRVVVLLGAELLSHRELGAAFNNPSDDQRVGYERTFRLMEAAVFPEGWTTTCDRVTRTGTPDFAGAEVEPPDGHPQEPDACEP